MRLMFVTNLRTRFPAKITTCAAAIKLASELSSRERLVRANRAHARSY